MNTNDLQPWERELLASDYDGPVRDVTADENAAMEEPQAPVGQSGSASCACRDCMDVCMTATEGGWTLCLPCLDATCTPWPGERYKGTEYECQRDDAYGAECASSDPDYCDGTCRN